MHLTMNSATNTNYRAPGRRTKTLRIMKLLAILLLAACLQVSAAGNAQSITLSEKNAPLDKVFKEIRKQSGYLFLYTQQMLQNTKKVNINVKNIPLEKVLAECFSDQPLTYTILNKTVIITPKEPVAIQQPRINEPLVIDVKGKVTNEKGEPLAGVSVEVKGESKFTTTDKEGLFTIKVNNENAMLVLSFVGYRRQEIKVNTKADLTITLQPSDSRLVEVLVVGYGTQDKRSVTGSVVKVKPEDISNLATTSIDKQLAGRAAGVQVTVNSGSTNSNPRIRIRGISSINQERSPLIVIDNVPMLTGNIGGQTETNALADINPGDIESIDVLKDGAATAIYGSRAANGVLMITTRKGKAGTMKVNYDGYVGFSNPVKKAKLLNADQFVEIQNEKFANSGSALRPAVADPNGVNTDWQSLLYHKNAVSHNHNLGFSGGNDKTVYYFSLNYNRQEGAIINNSTTRYSIRANLDHKLNKIIRIGMNTGLSRVDDIGVNNSSGLSSVISNSLIALPNVSPYNESDITGYNISGDRKSLGAGANLQTIDDAFPNVLFTVNNDKYTSEKYRILNSTYVEITPFSGLKFRSQVAADIQMATDFYSLDARHGDGYSYGGLVRNTYLNRGIFNVQNFFTFNKTINQHNATLVAGTELQRNNNKNYLAGGSGFSNIFFQSDNLISGSYNTQTSGGFYGKSGFTSYFARLNYDFDKKYFLSFSIRRDGLSSLPKSNRYGTFPGISAGWQVSDEKFWQGRLSTIVNSLKVRGSYAVVGNALTGFPYLSTFGAATYASQNGITITNVGNPDLSWETSKKTNIGADLGFLDDRITVTFDWFRNDIDNLVMDVPYAPSYGIPDNSISRNIGLMTNHGIELAVTADVIHQKQFTWNVIANYTNTKNKVKSLYQGKEINYTTSNLIREGLPLFTFYGFVYAGVNEATGNPMYYKGDGQLIQGNIADQKYYYAKSKDDGTLGATTTLVDQDKQLMGNPTPTWFGSITNTFTYKRFTLEAMVRYSGGNTILNSTLRGTLLNQKFKNNGAAILDRWTPQHTQTDVPKLWYGSEGFINLTSYATTRFLEKGDYLRLQNISLSYNVPDQQLKKITNGNIASARVFVQAQNVLTWTKYKGFDPDNITETGIDGNSIPPIRVVSIGLNVGF